MMVASGDDAELLAILKNLGPTPAQVREDIYQALRLALRDANAEHERCLEVLRGRFPTAEDFQSRREALGRAGGLARAMEIVEAMGCE